MLIARDYQRILIYLEALLRGRLWNLGVLQPTCSNDAGSPSSHSLTLSSYLRMYNIKHDRFWGQIINDSWKHAPWKDTSSFWNWLPDKTSGILGLVTLNLYEVHQSSCLGSLEKVRLKSEPADVVAHKHASIGPDMHAPVLCSFRWKPDEMSGHWTV